MCFNGAKTYQLGWRPTLDLAIKTNFVGNLTGFVDYNPSIVGQLCILKVITPTLFYFVHYNHQFGANADTQENGNKVMVATTGTSGSFSDLQSFVVAVLDSTRPTFFVSKVGGGTMDMTISVGTISGATAEVSVLFTAAPTPAPTPTRAPTTRAPTLTCLASGSVCVLNRTPGCCRNLSCKSSGAGQFKCR
jgi:hypothetical protein